MMKALILDARAGIVVGAPPAEHVTILGKGPSAAQGLRAGLKRGEVWGLNAWDPSQPCYGTRWFQIHPPEILLPEESVWLEASTVPIYTIKYHRGYPNAVRYPLEQVLAMPGLGKAPPLCSSFDYMIGLAVLEGFRGITVAGAELQLGSMRERLMEHVSLAFWVGYAAGRGLRVEVLGHVLQFPYRYGFDYWPERYYGNQIARSAVLSGLRVDDGAAKDWPRAWRGQKARPRTPRAVFS